MSPFFRGSVRPAKKHPRPWSLNPKLNPDLGTEGGGGARMSILGLPSQQTTVTLPVFNGVYPKPDEELLASPPAHQEEEGEPAKAVAADALAEPRETEKVAETSVAPAATVDVTSQPPSGEDADARNEVEPAGVGIATEGVRQQPASPTTQGPPEEPKPDQADEAHAAGEIPEDTPAPEAQETLAAQPSVSSPLPLPTESAAADDSVHPDSQEAVPEAPQQAAADVGEQQIKEEVAESSEREPQPVPVQAEEGSLVSVEQTVVSTPPPTEAVAEGVVPPVRDSPAEPLTTISEEPPAGAQQTLPAEPPPAPVEDPSLPTISEDHREAEDEEVVVEGHEESAESQEAEHASHALSTAEIAEGEKTEALPTEDHSAAAEAPTVPRHLDDSQDTAPPAAAGGDGDQAVAAEHPGVASHGPHASITSTSAEGSVANEPLITDEQLEVSDEFRPGVATYTTESSD